MSIDLLKECLKRIEELRLVDLGAIRAAEHRGCPDSIKRARKEHAETVELINDLNYFISKYSCETALLEAERAKVKKLLECNLAARQALADRFNRDWTDTSENIERALEETFTTQRREIMEALALANVKDGE